MAGISETPQNTYRVQIRRAGIPPIYKSFKTKEEASLWARQKELEIDTGSYINRKEAEKLTIGSLIDRYINEVSIHKKGYKQEKPRLKKLQREIGHYYLTKLQSKDIARFRDLKLKAGLAPSSFGKDRINLSTKSIWLFLSANEIMILKRNDFLNFSAKGDSGVSTGTPSLLLFLKARGFVPRYK